ncbi:MAG TPA: DUF1440 domain-containing protein [Candidatus Limnocylindrales bacterium]|nr:DUF1440 domain-containing protein [Candidatus Limnocylindrales bacterium]
MLTDVLRGALAGAVATWLMDQVTTTMLESQPDEVTKREEEARPNGKGTVPNLVDMVEDATGFQVEEESRPQLEMAVHYALGIVPGALYAVLRRRVPLLGAKQGLAYGFLLWALNDEFLNFQLGLAGPPQAYPAETHWRGLVGHLVLGGATDTTIDLLGG